MNKKMYRVIMTAMLLMSMNAVAHAQLNGLINRGKATLKNEVKKEAKKEAKEQGLNALTKVAGKESSFTENGHTYTQKGTLNIKTYIPAATGMVTFTNVPSNYDEFEKVYTEFLGKTPYGTAAMMPMAMAIYGRDRAEGEKCIRLINYPSNVNSVLSQLKEKFGTSQYAPANDSYHQPYLPAAVLEGATPQNAYTPKYPYTVNMRASVNKHQDMQLYDGRVMYIYMMGKGWDTEQRSVEIIQVNDGELFKVFNCPALYTQCKNIKGTWEGLK